MATTKLGTRKIRASFRSKREAEEYRKDQPKSINARIRSRRVASDTYYDVWTW